MELIAMLILLTAVAAIILWPMLRRQPDAQSGPEARGAVGPPPDSSRARALAAIKELEFDYATGKIAEEDYRVLRSRYETKAVEALQRSEPGGHPEARRAEGPPPSAGDDLDARLEAEIRAARGRRFCTHCGGELPKKARFCPACGTAVEVPA